jgi:hypothetical protein
VIDSIEEKAYLVVVWKRKNSSFMYIKWEIGSRNERVADQF